MELNIILHLSRTQSVIILIIKIIAASLDMLPLYSELHGSEYPLGSRANIFAIGSPTCHVSPVLTPWLSNRPLQRSDLSVAEYI